ncbi:phosphotransferase family protein, partial [Parvibaculum sp.]|uniref:phosphotransferase family protein n=1 Tax=Parvibaculum sp. TaxID=2024848 RepID=UPI002C6892C7
KIGRQFWTHLGKIAAAEPKDIGFEMEPVAPGECWKRELDKWEKVIDEDELSPQPIARAAIRWLRRNPPPPAQKLSVVHGDYRTGNFLVNGEGDIKAILDWEMCHLGDPLEDIAWAADPLWAFANPDRPGGMIPRAEAFRLWQETSGLKIDPVALRWWEIFNSLKGLAIWISAGKEYHTGANRDPILALSSWYCTDMHDRILAGRLSALSKEARA